MEEGQQEGSGFTGTGLGRGDDIIAFQYQGDNLFLDGCWFFITTGCNPFCKLFVEIKCCKLQWVFGLLMLVKIGKRALSQSLLKQEVIPGACH